MAAEGPLKLMAERPVSEIGELEINRRARWALNLDDDYGSRIYFDLQRNLKGKWGVDKVMLPPVLAPGEEIPGPSWSTRWESPMPFCRLR